MKLVRGILFGVLTLLEPLVTGLLSTLAVLGLLTAGLFHRTLPPGAPRHTATILAVSAACAISATIYRGITRRIEPRQPGSAREGAKIVVDSAQQTGLTPSSFYGSILLCVMLSGRVGPMARS